MIGDAIRGELAKLRANRPALALGIGVPVLVTLVFALVGQFAALSTPPELRALAQAPLMAEAAASLRAAGNPFTHIFLMAAAGIIFAGEYRWETWRFIATRNTRRNLIAAKFAAYALMAAIALALIVVVQTAVALIGGLVAGIGVEPGDARPRALAGLAAGFAASLLQLWAYGAIAGVLAVLTRSLLAVVLAVFMFSFWQTVAFLVNGGMQSDPRYIAGLPNLAGDVTRSWAADLAGLTEAGPAIAHAPLGVAGLLVWTLAGLGAAILLFGRQDLSRE